MFQQGSRRQIQQGFEGPGPPLLIKQLPVEVPAYGKYICHPVLTTGREQDACIHPLGNAD